MTGWTTGRRIAASFVVVLVLMALVVGIANYGLVTTTADFKAAVRASSQRAVTAQETRAEFNGAAVSFLRYLLTNDGTLVSQMDRNLSEAKSHVQQLLDATETPGPRNDVREVRRLMDAWYSAAQEVLVVHDAGDAAAEHELLTSKVFPARDAQRTLMSAIAATAVKDTNKKARTASSTSSRLTWVLLGVGLLALAAGVAVAIGLSRSIRTRLREAIGALASASTEILVSTRQQAAGVTEEQAALAQTSATTDEMRRTTEVVADKARLVAETVGRTVETSRNGERAVQQSVQGAADAKDRMEQIAQRILTLSERSQAIGEIIASVNDLAEQSNLLAVNASIEAARAGEAGRGFAVVAGEFKALAEESKQATTQIRGILGEIQRETQAAVMAAEQGVKGSEEGAVVAAQAGEAIRVLAESLDESSQAARQIRVSAEQQIAGADQVSLAMQNIQEASAQNMTATRQMEQAASDLAALAGRLTDLVGVANGQHRNGTG